MDEAENERPIDFAKDNRQGVVLTCLDIVTLLIVRLLIGLMYVLPERFGLALARALIWVLRLCMPRLEKVGLRNLELVFPEKSNNERQYILEKSFEVLARNLWTYAKIPELSKEKAASLIDFRDSSELLAEIRARHEKTGILLPTLHFGSFERLVQCTALLDRPVAFLARGFGLYRVDRWWNVRREMFGNQVFTRKGGYQEIVKRLRHGQDVALLFDQNVKANHAVYVDFFGRKAATTKTIGLAALRTGAPIVLAAIVEHRPNVYSLFLKEVSNPRSLPISNEEKIVRITRELHEHIENLIRTYPEQWFWIHRRFKTRPPGEQETLYDEI